MGRQSCRKTVSCGESKNLPTTNASKIQRRNVSHSVYTCYFPQILLWFFVGGRFLKRLLIFIFSFQPFSHRDKVYSPLLHTKSSFGRYVRMICSPKYIISVVLFSGNTNVLIILKFGHFYSIPYGTKHFREEDYKKHVTQEVCVHDVFICSLSLSR